MAIDVDVAVHAHPEHGEGPFWDDRTGTLVWVDIAGEAVHRFDPGTGVDEATPAGSPVGAAIGREAEGLALLLEDGFGLLHGDRVELVAPVEARNPGIRFNDGKADPAGRFWGGTMAYDQTPGVATLYRFDPDRTVHRMLEGLTVSNGLAWSGDHRRMFFIDTPAGGVDVLDYDLDTGGIARRRRLVDVSRGHPDGMTIDAEDCLWVALYGGSAVHRYTPDGRLDRVIELPVTKPTSCAFGGADLAELYITTTPEGLSEAERADQPEAGAVFVCRPGPVGLVADRYRG